MPGQRSVSDIVGWLRAADDPERLAGAAFLVSESLALTCAHVVRDHIGLGQPTPLQLPAGHLKLRFDWLGREVEAKVAPSGWWPDSGDGEIKDLAVLILHETLEDMLCPALAIVPPPPDLPCEVYGATGKYPPYGRTVKCQLTADPNNLGWRQLDARSGQDSGYIVERGFSGSPVLDPLRTTVWGMVATIETEPGRRVAFAIAIEHLRQATRIVAAEARQRHAPVAPATERSPDPMDQLGREALEALLGEALPTGAGQEIPPERVEELRAVVRSLVEAARAGIAQQHPEQAREPAPNRARIAHALEALAAGDSEQAEGLLGEVVELREAEDSAAQAQATEAYAEAAEAARHLGALAYDRDTRKAIGAYQTATRLNPNHIWSWIFLGRLHQQAGKLAAAEEAFKQARAAAERAGDERDVMVADSELGDVRVAAGDLAGALKAYEAALATARALTAQDPGNASWQRDLSVSFSKIGDVQRAQGNLDGALQAYQDGLDIREKLAAQDPGNAEWQRDLSVSFSKIGDVQSAQGNLDGALQAYQDGLDIREKLAAQDPGNAEWQRNLSVSFERIGDVQSARGNLDGALQAYQDGLDIREKLAAQDPGNAGWQRDLSVSFNKIGDVQRARGNLGGALQAYRDGLAIAEKLAAQDPGNAGWQRDLSVSFNKIGDVQRAQGNLDGALQAYQDGLAMREKLAAQDPGNAEWQRDLALSYGRIAIIDTLQGERERALAAFRKGRAIIVRLRKTSPDHAILASDLARFDAEIAKLAG